MARAPASSKRAYYNNPYGFMAASRVSVAVFGLAYLAVAVWLRRRRAAWPRALETAILLVPLVSPLLEYNHFLWVMPAFVLQLARWAAGKMRPAIAAGLLTGWFSLLYLAYNVQQYGFGLFGLWIQAAPMLGYGLVVFFTLLEHHGDSARGDEEI
ncbi:MAG: hypothetical protein M1457_00500 [bacterium]|nr:hypothetical protein [bacterium]